MRKHIPAAIASIIIICSFLFSGCFKDSYQKTSSYTYYKPVYKTTAEVRANIKSNAPEKIERPGKIFVIGQYIFLNEVDKGIHVIDNSNPAQPQNISFITIPGNLDIAVKGNTLYADMYTDFITLDISDPHQVVLKKVMENIFPHRYYNGYFIQDTTKVIASWEKRDTVVIEKGSLAGDWLKNTTDIFVSYSAMGVSGQSASVSPVGVGGSTSRFAILNDRLYTVGTSDLNVFNIINSVEPVITSRKNLSWNIETIYPFNNQLFIGSTTGMFIFNLSNPDNPVQSGQFSHIEMCDPVIADNQYAFVTLRSGTRCFGTGNELDVLSLTNPANPALLKIYQMTNPRGLSKDGSSLFICDGKDGLKIFNASDVLNLHLIKQFSGIEVNDVITINGDAIVVAEDGLYQYNYSNLNDIRLLSKIGIN